MSMFTTKSKTSDATPEDYPLPEGHDDPAGPFYVPEGLHDLWAKHADTSLAWQHTLLQGTLRVIAEHELEKRDRPENFDGSNTQMRKQRNDDGTIGFARVPAVKAPHLLDEAARLGRDGAVSFFAMTKVVQQEVGSYLNAHSDRLRPEAQHAIRLMVVVDEHAAIAEREARLKKEHAAHLCPVCGVSDPSNSPVVVREIATSMPYKRRNIVSCFPCYFVAIARLAARAEQEKVGTFPHLRTRAQAVDAFLNAKGL